MTKNNSLIPSIIMASALALLAMVIAFKPILPVFGSSAPTAPAMTVATTSASFSITTSARVLATTTNVNGAPGVGSFTRAHAVICNPTPNAVYLNLDGDKAANAVGAYTAVIGATSSLPVCYTLTDAQMIYNGSITASSTNGTATVISVKEYVY